MDVPEMSKEKRHFMSIVCEVAKFSRFGIEKLSREKGSDWKLIRLEAADDGKFGELGLLSYYININQIVRGPAHYPQKNSFLGEYSVLGPVISKMTALKGFLIGNLLVLRISDG
jgi:hypothetical protein